MAFSFSGAINNVANGLTNNASDVVTLLNEIKAVLNNGITGPAHLSPTAGIVGTQLDSSAAIVGTQLAASANILNTQLDATTVLDKAGVSSAVVRRGKTNISATESRTNVAYGTLTTPDQVASVVLPTDGLIAVAYQATWQESVQGAGRAAIFVGSNQLNAFVAGNTNPSGQEAKLAGDNFTNPAGTTPAIPTAAQYELLVSTSFGLTGVAAATGIYTGDVTTGQAVGGVFSPATNSFVSGGPVYIFAAAGTYTISVQFKSSSGSVTAKNRKLWVWTLGF